MKIGCPPDHTSLMRLQKLGERELLEVIKKHFSMTRPGLFVGIGDDAAVIGSGKKRLLITKDLLIEDYDFIRRLQDPRFLGRKSLNVNLSDIAAMGGRPLYAVLGLGIPRDTALNWVVEFFAGIKQAARTSGVALIGGDLSQSRNVVISLTLVGEVGRPVLRSGARPGDHIFISGFLGDAKQGFLFYKNGCRLGESAEADPFLKAFLDPQPQTALGRKLAEARLASAMIDCSDGLSVDILHICESSGTGAEIDLEKIPVSPQLRRLRKNPLSLALHGGEDFQLIFTVKPRNLSNVKRLAKKFPLTEVGRIRSEKGIWAVDIRGRRKVLEIKGYEHFR